MSEENFRRAFPDTAEPRYFLLDVPKGREEALARSLRENLGRQGVEVRTTREILNNFIGVQNTYLSMFLALGGLGVIMGTFGLVAVLLRGALERRGEFALMLAQGFGRRDLAWLLAAENAGLLVAGLALGGVCALVAVAPEMASASFRNQLDRDDRSGGGDSGRRVCFVRCRGRQGRGRGRYRSPAGRIVMKFLTFLMVFLATCACAGQPDDWPSFRGGPLMDGIASPMPARSRLLWTYQAKRGTESTAAIVGDSVYLGTKGGGVLALRLSDGKLRWKFTANDSVSASPCVVGNAVYAGDENGAFYAINRANGKLIWKFKTKDKIISSATPAPGVVLVGWYDYNLYCLDAHTGRLRWAFTADAQVHCSPCVAEGRAIIAGCDGSVRSIDLATGREKSKARVDENLAVAPAYQGGVVFVGTLTGEYSEQDKRFVLPLKTLENA